MKSGASEMSLKSSETEELYYSVTPPEAGSPDESPRSEPYVPKEVRWGCPPDSRCAAGFPKIPVEDLQELLNGLPNWVLSEDGTAIERRFVARNWAAGELTTLLPTRE